MATHADISGNLTIGALQSVRRNAGDTAFEAFTPAAGTISSGTAGRIAEYATATTLQSSTLIKSGAGVLTLSAASNFTATFASTGTVQMEESPVYTDYIIPNSANYVTANADTTTNNAIKDVFSVYASVTGGSAAGFGSRLRFELDSSTSLQRLAAQIDAVWNVATHASRVGDLVLSAAYSGGTSEGLRIRGGSGVLVGLFGVTPIARPTTSSGAAAFTANSGTAINDASTFDGYTLKQVVKALRDIGILT